MKKEVIIETYSGEIYYVTPKGDWFDGLNDLVLWDAEEDIEYYMKNKKDEYDLLGQVKKYEIIEITEEDE